MRYAIQDKKRFIGLALFCLNVLILGVIIRLPLIYYISDDYVLYLNPWYDTIVDEGLAAWGQRFSNYNPPYLYLLSLPAFFLSGLSSQVAIKLVSTIFDFVLAFFVYKCVALQYKRTVTTPCLAALVTLLAPFVVLNSSAWGQADSIYTAFLVACLYALLRERQAWAFIAFGLSFSIKSQAMFLAPLFLWLSMKKQVKWRYSFLSLLIYLVLLLPAWFIGRSFGELLLIYFRQVGHNDRLSMNAPNLYEWIPNHYYRWYPLGIVFTILVVLAIAVYIYIYIHTHAHVRAEWILPRTCWSI